MKKNKLTPKEISKINSIFYKNNVSLSFEKIEDYYNCFEDMTKLMFSIRKKQLLEEISPKIIEEYDLSIGNIVITKSLLYRYDSAILHDDKKIHEQMIIIRDFFHFNINHYTIFDTDDFFGVSYDITLKVKQGYYYFLMPGLMKSISDDIFFKMMNSLNFGDVVDYFYNFKTNCNLFELYYFSFDSVNSLRNVGFMLEKSNDVIDTLSNYYSEYEKFAEVIDFLKNTHKEEIIGLQYGIGDKTISSFGIEIRILPEDVEEYVNQLCDKNVINCKDTVLSIFQKNEKKDSFVIKFKWSLKKRIKIKLYTVEYNHSLYEKDNPIRITLDKINDE